MKYPYNPKTKKFVELKVNDLQSISVLIRNEIMYTWKENLLLSTFPISYIVKIIEKLKVSIENKEIFKNYDKSLSINIQF